MSKIHSGRKSNFIWVLQVTASVFWAAEPEMDSPSQIVKFEKNLEP